MRQESADKPAALHSVVRILDVYSEMMQVLQGWQRSPLAWQHCVLIAPGLPQPGCQLIAHVPPHLFPTARNPALLFQRGFFFTRFCLRFYSLQVPSLRYCKMDIFNGFPVRTKLVLSSPLYHLASVPEALRSLQQPNRVIQILVSKPQHFIVTAILWEGCSDCFL